MIGGVCSIPPPTIIHFPPLHNKYSRIDFFLLSQLDLPYLSKAMTEPLVFSDHHPITMTLTLPLTKLCCLDASLLCDPIDSLQLQLKLREFLTLNDTADVSPKV